MVVSKDFLREVFEILLERAADGSQTVKIDGDYFWSVPPGVQADMHTGPPELTVGQYSECVDNLEAVVRDPESAVGYGLVWLADVLRAVGAHEVG